MERKRKKNEEQSVNKVVCYLSASEYYIMNIKFNK